MDQLPLDSTLVERVLTAARRVTGTEFAYLSQFEVGRQLVRAVDGDPPDPGVEPGTSHPLEESTGQWVVDGRLEHFAADTLASPAASAIVRASGTAVRSYVSVPVRYPDRRLWGSLCCVHRTTLAVGEREQHQLEDLAALLGHQLHADHVSRRLERERTELLESVTHDLRTPLMALRFIGEDLVTGSTEPEAAGRQVEREATRVLSMVEDIMLVTRQRAGTAFLQPRPTDLVQIAEEAARNHAQAFAGGPHELVVDLADEPLVADVDANRVLRALQNLLDNARAYSPEGGEVRLGLRRDGPTAVFEVVDQGMGIDPDDLPRLVERFFRSESAVAAGTVGTGLGLTTVQAVADLHEGTLQITSQPGVGSTFALRLPLRRPGR